MEQWRSLVEAVGLPVEWALSMIRCESRGNQHAVNPRGPYVGLAQVLNGSTDPRENLEQAKRKLERQGRGAWPTCG